VFSRSLAIVAATASSARTLLSTYLSLTRWFRREFADRFAKQRSPRSGLAGFSSPNLHYGKKGSNPSLYRAARRIRGL